VYANRSSDPGSRATGDDGYFYVSAGNPCSAHLGGPADALQMNGTLVFEEIGRPPKRPQPSRTA
jgi:hypothetical protein